MNQAKKIAGCVIPACAAQRLSRTFTHYVLLSVGLGVFKCCVRNGVTSSSLTDSQAIHTLHN